MKNQIIPTFSNSKYNSALLEEDDIRLDYIKNKDGTYKVWYKDGSVYEGEVTTMVPSLKRDHTTKELTELEEIRALKKEDLASHFLPHGQGKLTLANGDIWKGKFEYNKPVKNQCTFHKKDADKENNNPNAEMTPEKSPKKSSIFSAFINYFKPQTAVKSNNTKVYCLDDFNKNPQSNSGNNR